MPQLSGKQSDHRHHRLRHRQDTHHPWHHDEGARHHPHHRRVILFHDAIRVPNESDGMAVGRIHVCQLLPLRPPAHHPKWCGGNRHVQAAVCRLASTFISAAITCIAKWRCTVRDSCVLSGMHQLPAACFCATSTTFAASFLAFSRICAACARVASSIASRSERASATIFAAASRASALILSASRCALPRTSTPVAPVEPLLADTEGLLLQREHEKDT
mmetsp:Transcript_22455/g.45248  ORF Transcript_22455/g.45248 Transcript_22455/m.45248 type:complete len:218 (+) Transcript_22455:376-1029(+)